MSVDASHALLRWFAVDKRQLPWRAEGEERPDPYRVWLSEVMLQQTTCAHSSPYFHAFTRRWPTVSALAAAPELVDPRRYLAGARTAVASAVADNLRVVAGPRAR